MADYPGSSGNSSSSNPTGVPTRLNNLESALSNRSLQQDQQNPFSLPDNYMPSPKDICCGRGKRNWNHSGNVAFRSLIQNSVNRYIEAPNKTAKTAVVVSIVDDIRQSGAYFLKQDDSTGRWYDIGDQQAREKVGHSLRDQVTAQKKNAANDDSIGSSNIINKNPPEEVVVVTATPQPVAVTTSTTTTSSMLEMLDELSSLPAQVSVSSSSPTMLEGSSGGGGGGGIMYMNQHVGPPIAMDHHPYQASFPNQQQQQQQPFQPQQQQQQQQQQQFHQQQQHHHNNHTHWARQSMVRRPSETWSDDEGEIHRRQSLPTTQVLEEFGRRPSWIEMSFGSTSTPSSSLRSAALRAAEALEEEEERLQQAAAVAAAGGGMTTNGIRESIMPMDWNPRDSAVSMMSMGESYSDMEGTSFANVFRGSLSSRSSNAFRMSHRKSSVNWLTEQQQQKDMHSWLDNAHHHHGTHEGFGDYRSSTLNAFAEIQRLEASGEMGLEDDF